MTVPRAVGVIEELARDNADLIVGAGTAFDLDIARKHEVVVFPGALTPTEIAAAWKAGADFVKVFPCSLLGGAGYIRAESGGTTCADVTECSKLMGRQRMAASLEKLWRRSTLRCAAEIRDQSLPFRNDDQDSSMCGFLLVPVNAPDLAAVPAGRHGRRRSSARTFRAGRSYPSASCGIQDTWFRLHRPMPPPEYGKSWPCRQ